MVRNATYRARTKLPNNIHRYRRQPHNRKEWYGGRGVEDHDMFESWFDWAEGESRYAQTVFRWKALGKPGLPRFRSAAIANHVRGRSRLTYTKRNLLERRRIILEVNIGLGWAVPVDLYD